MPPRSGRVANFPFFFCVWLALSLSPPSLSPHQTTHANTHSHIAAETTLQMTLVSPSRSLVHSLCSLRPLGPQRVLVQVQARGHICGGINVRLSNQECSKMRLPKHNEGGLIWIGHRVDAKGAQHGHGSFSFSRLPLSLSCVSSVILANTTSLRFDWLVNLS